MNPLKIGETTTYKGVELVCVEDYHGRCCDGCYFLDVLLCPSLESGLVCLKHLRPDSKSVHFEVKEGKE